MSLPPIAILCGGVASRMGALTRTTPKSLLTVAGEPFIHHQLRLLKRQGANRVLLCVGHLSAQIEAAVGDGSRFGLDIVYSADGPRLMGTGGAIRRACPQLGPEFMILYGDSYLDIAWAPVYTAFRQAGTPGLMTVLHNRGKWDTSNVEFRDGVIVEYSKVPTPGMGHIDYGLSVVKREVFDATPKDLPFDLAAVFTELVRRGQMAGYEVTTRFYEIGSLAGLAETDAYLRNSQA